MIIYDKKAFCRGALCRRTDRKYKSIVSNIRMCGVCSIEIDKKTYCSIDELLFSDDIRIKEKLIDISKDIIGVSKNWQRKKQLNNLVQE